MLHMGGGHSINRQTIIKLFRYYFVCNNLQHKKITRNLEMSDVLITYVTNWGKARVVMLQVIARTVK